MSEVDYPNLISQRPEAYEALFKGEMIYDEQLPVSELGLSGLWRVYSVKPGGAGAVLERRLDAVPERVGAILHEHDEQARDLDYQGDAIFSILSPSTMPDVIDTTSRIIKLWEKALYRNKKDPFFEGRSYFVTRSLTLEAAAAVLQTLPRFAKKPLKGVSETDKQRLATILANWGPNFLRSWLDGTIAADWLEKEGTSAQDIEEWRTIFNFSAFKYFAYKNVPDPLDAIRRYKEGYESLTDEAVMKRTDWTLAETQEVMTSARRKQIVKHNMTDPLRGIEKVKEGLALLTDDAIAKRPGWTSQEVAEITPALRRVIAVESPSDPFGALDRIKARLDTLTTARIAEHLQVDPSYVEQTFTRRDILYAAVHTKDPLDLLKRANRNLELLSAESGSKKRPGRTHFKLAINNVDNPLDALRKHIKNTEANP